MARARPRHRRDGNQTDIVRALEKCGVRVWEIERPVDLLCWYRGRFRCIEIKNPDADNPRPSKGQEAFVAATEPHSAICYTFEEALAFLQG